MDNMTDLSKHQNLIRGMVLKVAGHQIARDEVEDLIQAINLELIDGKLDQYDPTRGMELSSFIGMVARRYTIDEMKKRSFAYGDGRRFKESVGAEDDCRYDEVKDTTTDVLSLLVKRSQLAQVREAIKCLPADAQDLIEAICDDDFDPEKYAESRGIPVGKVYSMKCRAIAKLRAILGIKIKKSAA